jgi:hypothetical protein
MSKLDKLISNIIGIILILAVIVMAFFLNTFRWGYCP